MNCVNGVMKYNHLTKPLFQPIVSAKRAVKLERIQPLQGLSNNLYDTLIFSG